MRALLEDRFYDGVSPSGGISFGLKKFVLHRPNWTSSSPQIDLYFRIDKPLGGENNIEVYAFATIAEARAHTAGDVPASFLAYGAILSSALPDDLGSAATLVLNPNFGETPQISVSISIYGSQGNAGTISGLMVYTAAPDLYACDAIVEVLGEYASEGLVLEDFAGTPTRIAVGDPGAARAMPYISVRTTEFEFLEEHSTGSIYATNYTIEISVQALRLDSGDEAGPREKAWRTCRSYQAALESILFDERRTLDGTAAILTALQGTAPQPTEDSLLYEATVEVGAEFWIVWPENQ